MRRPVMETLERVDYTLVDEDSFERVVLHTHERVMLLVVTDNPEATGNNASRGMAALATALKRMYPDKIKLAVWMVNTTGFVDAKEFQPLHDEYGFHMVPELLFYSDFAGTAGINTPFEGTQLDTGITWENDLLFQVDYYGGEVLPERILFLVK